MNERIKGMEELLEKAKEFKTWCNNKETDIILQNFRDGLLEYLQEEIN